MTKRKKKKKWVPFFICCLLGVGLYLGIKESHIFTDLKAGDTQEVSENLNYIRPYLGKVVSTKLLTGHVIAKSEQVVLYDAQMGEISEFYVKQGDQVAVNQHLFCYDTAVLTANRDTALRALNKVDRQIATLEKDGKTVSLTGDAATDEQAKVEAQKVVNEQMTELQDSRAEAQEAVNKADRDLNSAVIKSNINGTVVKVNQDISRVSAVPQTVIQIVDSNNWQVTGQLTEFDLPNIQVGQQVQLTSRVYPNQAWTGTISEISSFPEETSANNSMGVTSDKGSYPFKIDVQGDFKNLRQGLTMSVEVTNQTEKIIVPVSSSITEEGQDYVYIYKYDGTLQKTAVTLGNMDGKNQEILLGISLEDRVITNPNANLIDGQKVKAYEETSN